jgi:predicted Fe-Mo cluster-binding NifX family protein
MPQRIGRHIVKIAVVSEEGTTISQHFGRAPYFVVLTIEEGKIVNKETRQKTGHHTFAAHEHPELGRDERHGYDVGAEVRHASIAESISDCQVLLAGGMGWGAYESMQSYNIAPIITDVKDIGKAVQLYLAGKLPNLMEKLH